MKVIFAIISLITFSISTCVYSSESMFYFREHPGILNYKAVDTDKSIEFTERDEGNSSYFFDYFYSKPSLVHQNNSLNAYSSYSTLVFSDEFFINDCVFVDFRSGQNGIYGKRGVCGIDLKIKKTLKK